MSDVYARLGLSRVINAAGRMTMLGGSALSDEVAEAMAEAGRTYVRVAELHDRAGELIARHAGAEAACVTTGAAAGIVIMTAACVAGADPKAVERLPDVAHEKREVLIQVGHFVGFGAPVEQMVRMGGGRPVAVGRDGVVRREDLEGAIGPNTAAFLYVQSHHTAHEGMLPLETCIAACHARGVPVIVDAAAEEDPRAYVAMGADLVTYSGGKAFGGPTSGFVAGRRDLVAGCRAQERGIARPMKVGKEQIVGLLVALERYAGRDEDASFERQQRIVGIVLDGLRGLPGIALEELHDEAGRRIVRAGIRTERAPELARFLAEGTPPIYPRGHKAGSGLLAIDPRPIDEADARLIVERIKEWSRTNA